MPGHFGVLLDRRVAGLQDHRQRLRHVADDPAGGAEVEQQRPLAALQQDHVVGGDVAVEALLGVDHGERLGQRLQQLAQPLLVGRRAHRLELVLERDAFVERHHHVGGAVRLPEAIDLDQRRMVELGQQPRLVDEALQPGLEGLAVPLRLDRDLGAADALRQRRRHVFLERDAAAERMVVGEVDDAEAALAEHLDDLELAQVEADRQHVAALRGGHALRRRRRAAAAGSRWHRRRDRRPRRAARTRCAPAPSPFAAPPSPASARATAGCGSLRRRRRCSSIHFASLPSGLAGGMPNMSRMSGSVGAAFAGLRGAAGASPKGDGLRCEPRTARAGRPSPARLRPPSSPACESAALNRPRMSSSRSAPAGSTGAGSRAGSEQAEHVVLGDDFARLIERARGRVAADLEQGEDVVVGQQLARPPSRLPARPAPDCRTWKADRRCPRRRRPRRMSGAPRPMRSRRQRVLRLDRGIAGRADRPGAAAAGEHADEFVEARQAIAHQQLRPARRVGDPERQAAHRRPRRRRARRGGEDRRRDRPGWRCRRCRRSRRGAPPHRRARGAPSSGDPRRRRCRLRPAAPGRRGRSRDRRWSSRPGARRARCPRGDAARRARRRTRRRDREARDSEATSVSGKWRPTRSTEGTSTPAKASSGRTPRSAPGDEQEAPRRRVEIGVEPAFAEGAALRLQPLAEPEVPGLDEIGLEAARREVAERRQLAVPPGDPRDVARDVHGSTGASHGVDTLPRANPGTGTAGSPSGGRD